MVSVAPKNNNATVLARGLNAAMLRLGLAEVQRELSKTSDSSDRANNAV